MLDGKWHMVTLTTHTDGSRGYDLFIDAVRRASLNGSTVLTGRAEPREHAAQEHAACWYASRHCPCLLESEISLRWLCCHRDS